MVAIRVIDTFYRIRISNGPSINIKAGFKRSPVPYTLEQAAQLGMLPSHLDFLLLHAIQAVLTHRRLIAAASLLLLDFFFVGVGAPFRRSEPPSPPPSPRICTGGSYRASAINCLIRSNQDRRRQSDCAALSDRYLFQIPVLSPKNGARASISAQVG